MNSANNAGILARLRFQLALRARYLRPRLRSASLGRSHPIERIYVINLDRQPLRWRQMTRELGRIADRAGTPVSSIARRFSAIDYQYLEAPPSAALVQADYSLADQLSSNRIRSFPQTKELVSDA
jgi:hypothetical protein